jgi:hypothetical protein
MLAPGNLPRLEAADGHRFLIAAPIEDWDAIEHLPVMERAREHVTISRGPKDQSRPRQKSAF